MAKAPPTIVSKESLAKFIHELFESAGLPGEQAAVMADIFTWADSRGVGSHGVARIPRYLELIESGEANARADIKIERTRPGTILIDADQAPGPVALSIGMQEAIKAARETGIACASVRGTVHTGAMGYYTQMAANEGMIGMAMVAGVPNMGYYGAKGGNIATSPLSIAVPTAGETTPILDMATATIALGKINQYKIRGEQLPEGAAMTAEGDPTTDPNVAAIPSPMSGAKGSGMSLMFELLSSVLVNNPIFSSYHSGVKGHRQNGTLIVLDPSAFGDLGAFKGNVEAALATVKGLPVAEGFDEVMFPGERGARMAVDRNAKGIPVPAATWEKLVADAEKLGVSVPAAVE